MTLLDGPWYLFPARVICALAGHAPRRYTARFWDPRVRSFAMVTVPHWVLYCPRCHVVTDADARATVTPDG